MILPLHAAATWFMTGVIWFVHLVHYPLMARVGPGGFAAYQAEHTRRTSWVVGPAMAVEAASGILLVIDPRGVPVPQAWTGLALLGLIWFSTAVLQVPRHRELSSGFDERSHRRLVRTNRIRVAGWTARAALVALWVV